MSDQNSPSQSPVPSQSSSTIPSTIPTLRPKTQKPSFARPAASDLQSRLQSFLPQMAAANAELEKLAKEGGLEGKRLEDVGEGEEYVEMELGLGVMEAKKEGEDSSDDSSDESSDESSEDSSEADDDEADTEEKKKQKEKEQKEKDILGRLMGHKQGREKAAATVSIPSLPVGSISLLASRSYACVKPASSTSLTTSGSFSPSPDLNDSVALWTTCALLDVDLSVNTNSLISQFFHPVPAFSQQKACFSKRLKLLHTHTSIEATPILCQGMQETSMRDHNYAFLFAIVQP
ncbi:hypothetical protein E4T42_04223 [Aureobasidium subglaciale]|nr:hypothetical protein E4T42_04223 [Aureobasidium subglaciale]